MDYTRQPLRFRLQKVWRYIRLYGLARTWLKVQAQYHLNRTFSSPYKTQTPNPNAVVGLIGCGRFAFANIAFYLRHLTARPLRGVMDVQPHRAHSLALRYKAAYATTDAEQLMADAGIRLIFIASNHASHADYAIQALAAGKLVHLEKPPIVDESQLRRLCAAMHQNPNRLRVGYNRPDSPLGRQLLDYVARETGPMLLNWFVAGHQLEPDNWYFDEKEGGRVLGNLCHWIDFSLRLIPENARLPLDIIPSVADAAAGSWCVTYRFAEGSVVVITFSAKGHTFEGVRETLNLHKGQLLASLSDFQQLDLQIGTKVIRQRLRFRDHGHRQRIQDSVRMLTNPNLADRVSDVWLSGWVLLKTKQALESGQTVVVPVSDANGWL